MKKVLTLVLRHIVDKGWVDVFIDHDRPVCRGCEGLSWWSAGGWLGCLSQVFQNALKVAK